MGLELPPIPARIGRLDPEVPNRIARALLGGGTDGTALAWAEKLRRFVEINRPNLRAVARERFGRRDAAAMLGRAADVLCAAALRQGPRKAPDLAFVNAALWALDLLPEFRRSAADGTVAALDSSAPGRYGAAVAAGLVAEVSQAAMGRLLGRRAIVPAPSGLNGEIRAAAPGANPSPSFRVVVFCPQPRSLYTLIVLALLRQAEIPIAGVLLRAMTAQRFAEEFRRDGFRLLRKVWRKLVLQGDENRDASDENLSAIARGLQLTGESVPGWARKHDVPCLRVSRFDTPVAVQFLRQADPSYAVFTGGGLIAPETIAACGGGVVNCHTGVLPQYKGMDVVEWPLLEGIHEQIGATTHLMARSIDTGPLLRGFTLDPRGYPSLGALRNAIMGRMCGLMRDTVVGLRDGTITPQAQSPGGRQYFTLHPGLRALLPLVFRAFARP
jgi:hypothetical protein